MIGVKRQAEKAAKDIKTMIVAIGALLLAGLALIATALR